MANILKLFQKSHYSFVKETQKNECLIPVSKFDKLKTFKFAADFLQKNNRISSTNVFEAVQKNRSMCIIGFKSFKTDKTLLLVFLTIIYKLEWKKIEKFKMKVTSKCKC